MAGENMLLQMQCYACVLPDIRGDLCLHDCASPCLQQPIVCVTYFTNDDLQIYNVDKALASHCS